MGDKNMSFWLSLRFIALGAAVGLLALITLRVAYYQLIALTPDMHSGAAYYFVPVLLLAVLVAAPLEVALRRWSFVPTRRSHAFLVGITHASLLILWVFPIHWPILLAINPITLRWLLGKLVAQQAVAADVARPAGERRG